MTQEDTVQIKRGYLERDQKNPISLFIRLIQGLYLMLLDHEQVITEEKRRANELAID
jgi:hypothetical protein